MPLSRSRMSSVVGMSRRRRSPAQQGRRNRPGVETLEGRQLLSVVQMAPRPPLAGPVTADQAPQRLPNVAVAPAFGLTGPWTDFGTGSPSIIENNGNIVIDMSFANRPTAFGLVLDPTTIKVFFRDASTLIGTLSSNRIQWENGSTWAKVYNGPMPTDVNGAWTDTVRTAHIQNVGGYLTVDMTEWGRPAAHGFVANPSTIFVSFPDDASYVGTVLEQGFIHWSNDSFWQRPIIF